MTQALLAALQNPAFYPHPVQQIQLIETHISWVILTGEYAYKIKKPVNFGFLDFTSLEARQHFCHQELMLNQRLAPELYLEVIPVTGTASEPVLGGTGEAIEYVLKMREFPQRQLLAQVQNRGELTDKHIDALASQIGCFHLRAPVVKPEHALNTPSAIVAPMYQNFEQIRPLLTQAEDLAQLDRLETWTHSTIQRLMPLLEQRCQKGMVRECHGDLHLGNAVLMNGEVVLFDCIEFNEPFRMIDIASDAAFLALDLEDRGLVGQAYRFMNAWLECTGDYAALPLLNLYKAYRALVRAKVNLFRLAQEADAAVQQSVLTQYRSYARLAERYAGAVPRFLAITHGISAVGKSLVSLRVVEACGAIRIRSDVERKRLFGENTEASTLEAGIYTPAATEATYEHLNQLARLGIQAGFPVVLDATYLKGNVRDAAASVASELDVPFIILDCQAPEALILQWLEERQAQGGDPSDATVEVLRAQQASAEPLTAQEEACSVQVETHTREGFNNLFAYFRQHFSAV